MPARARRLTRVGIPRVPGVPPVFALAAVLAALVMVSGCAGVPSSASRTPPASNTPTAVTIVTPSPTPQLVGTTRTVLSPLGLRIHSAPVLELQERHRGLLARQDLHRPRLSEWWRRMVPRPGSDTRRVGRRRSVAHRRGHVQPVHGSERRDGALPAIVGVPAGAGWHPVRSPAGGHGQRPARDEEQPQVIRGAGIAGVRPVQLRRGARVRLHRDARVLREGRLVHRSDPGTAPGCAPAALCRDSADHRTRRTPCWSPSTTRTAASSTCSQRCTTRSPSHSHSARRRRWRRRRRLTRGRCYPCSGSRRGRCCC